MDLEYRKMTRRPKWLRGIVIDRIKILKETSNEPQKQDEILEIHYPSMSPQMVKHLKFLI